MMCFLSKSVLSFQQQQHVCGSCMAKQKTKLKFLSSESQRKKRAFLKKNKEGLQRSILEFVERALKSFSVTDSAAFAAFSSSAFCLLSIFVPQSFVCVFVCERRRR